VLLSIELNDLKLLLDKSYTLFSTKDRKECLEDMPTTTTLSLLLMAIKFKFRQCTEALCDHLEQILEEKKEGEVEEEEEEEEGRKPAASTARDVLTIIDRLYHLEEKNAKSSSSSPSASSPIRDLLAIAVKSMGIIEQLWAQSGFTTTSPLEALSSADHCPQIQAITTTNAMIYLLKHDDLMMTSEDTTFTLLEWWLMHREGWTSQQKKKAWEEVVASGARRLEYMHEPSFHCQLCLPQSHPLP